MQKGSINIKNLLIVLITLCLIGITASNILRLTQNINQLNKKVNDLFLVSPDKNTTFWTSDVILQNIKVTEDNTNISIVSEADNTNILTVPKELYVGSNVELYKNCERTTVRIFSTSPDKIDITGTYCIN